MQSKKVAASLLNKTVPRSAYVWVPFAVVLERKTPVLYATTCKTAVRVVMLCLCLTQTLTSLLGS